MMFFCFFYLKPNTVALFNIVFFIKHTERIEFTTIGQADYLHEKVIKWEKEKGGSEKSKKRMNASREKKN